MSSVSEQLSQGAEKVQDYARANPYKFAGLLSATATFIAGGFAYWNLKARPHPSTMSIDLPMHHFSGHVPAMKEAAAKEQWLQMQAELLNREDVKKAGIATLCLPNIMVPYIHYIVNPELIKYLWTDLDLPKGERRNDCFRELFDKSIFLSSAEQWRWHRKIIGKMFSLHNLRDYMFRCSTSGAQRTVDMIKDRMKQQQTISGDSNSICVDLFDVLGRFTMDSFIEISFGRHTSTIESYPKPCEFGVAFDRGFSYGGVRFRDPFWKVKRYFQMGEEARMSDDIRLIMDYIDKLLDMDHRRELFDETGVDKYDVVSLYLKDNPNLSKSVLRGVAVGMIVAGRDTTRNLLAWCLALLCTSQKEWLAKVCNEIDEIDSQELRYEDAKKRMHVTECVLLETLRLYPPVTSSTRVVDRDLTTVNGLKLMKGDLVTINHFAQGRNTDIYGEDAAEFNPMRWSEKGLNSFPPEKFGAFHQSPRMCLGREFALTEAKTFLFYFLKSFEHRSVGDVFPALPNSILLLMNGGWKVDLTAKKA